MTEINKAGTENSLGHIDTAQGEFRSQIDALTDAVRQLGGNPTIAPDGVTRNDPLSAPYILYVNSYTGSDKFVTGDYASADDGTFAAKMRRISNQRLECGYTEARPFQSLTRAVIEAAIISSRDYLTLGKTCGDNITIVVASGIHEACNGPGKTANASNFPVWADGEVPTTEQLQSFNPSNGGLILPRSVSIISADLRKTRISPCYVPSPEDEKANLKNRSAIFRMTGGCYFYGFSFVDKIKSEESHHLLSCFEFASTEQLDEFYKKIRLSFSGVAGINDAFAVTRNYENRIVGPAPEPGVQTEATDTTEGSSPYIYNCSIRSNYGLCGVLLDGDMATGFKSTVIAQFTGVSLQRDMSCWQVYKSQKWINYSQAEYADYIDETPDNVRMDPNRRSFHIRAINRAIIQEVSVFAIGQGVHHWVQSAGELTVTNSNSNFGGVSALAEGFVDYSFETDKNWNVGFIKVAEDIQSLKDKTQTYFLGTIINSESDSSLNITLESELEGEEENRPALIDRDGYSLESYGGTNYIWVENPNGPDYYAPLADRAWRTSSPGLIRISAPFVSASDGLPPSNPSDPLGPLPPIGGKRLYIRRLRDVRSVDERRYSLICNNTASDSRNIIRDYGLQTATSSSSIDTEIEAKEALVAASIAIQKAEGGVKRTNEIELRRACASDNWDDSGEYLSTGYHLANNFYRTGDVVRYRNKHWKCVSEHVAGTFDDSKWDECFVHMDENYGAEDYFKNVQPVIIFDKDTDDTNEDPLLGYSNKALSTDDELKRQVRTATDYLGLFSFLQSLGFNKADTHNILAPKPEADRVLNPINAFDGIAKPNAAANAWDNWEIEFRRPSNIRLFGQAFEWTGQLNYTKALPQYQRDLSASNKFTYFFTNNIGGRVYVSGFNEEGFGVSAAGLTDLQTGETLSPDSIGSDDRDPNAPVTFNGDVLIQGTLNANNINSSQTSLVKGFGNNDTAPSSGRGMSWIAPMENIITVDTEKFALNTRNEENGGVSPSNAGGYTGASFITPYYLDTWRSRNRLLGAQEGPIYIFINPRAKKPASSDITFAVQNESTNWNANSVTDLINNPPTVPGNACPTISLAVEYANATINTATRIIYYCGCGLYTKDTGTITFNHVVSLVGFNYANNDVADDPTTSPWLGTINDERGGTTASTRGRFPENTFLSRLRDTNAMPIFLTKLEVTVGNVGTQLRISVRPLMFFFKQAASLKAVTWWGLSETLRGAQGDRAASNTRIPNNWYTGLTQTQLEYTRSRTSKDICNAAIYYLLSGKGNLDYLDVNGIITTKGQLTTENVCVTATGFSGQRGGRSDNAALITCDAEAVLLLSGLTLVGNNNFDSESTITGANRPLWGGSNTYDMYGFMPTMISTSIRAADAVVSFGFARDTRRIIEGPSDYNYNLTSTNWHLLTNEGKYMTKTDSPGATSPTTDKDKMGPAFKQTLGNLLKKRRVLRFAWNSYRAGDDAGNRSGVAGYFGMFRDRREPGDPTSFYVGTLSAAYSTDAKSPKLDGEDPQNYIPQGTTWDYENTNCMFRKNGTTYVADVPIPRPIGQSRIIENVYNYGKNDNYDIGIKYAAINYGIDYIRNYQSNRVLFG